MKKRNFMIFMLELIATIISYCLSKEWVLAVNVLKCFLRWVAEHYKKPPSDDDEQPPDALA